MSAHQLIVGQVVFGAHELMPFTARRESLVAIADRELLRRVRRTLGLKPGDDLIATVKKLAQAHQRA